jgi:hypothetical protein
MCWVIILGYNYCIMTSHREKMYIEKIQVPLLLPSLYFTPNRLLHLSFNSSFRTVAIITQKAYNKVRIFYQSGCLWATLGAQACSPVANFAVRAVGAGITDLTLLNMKHSEGLEKSKIAPQA